MLLLIAKPLGVIKMRHLLILILFVSSCSSSACDCAAIKDLKGVQNQQYDSSDLVFVGRVSQPSVDGSFGFEVIELFKGNSSLKSVKGVCDNFCCYSPSDIGVLWLVYATVDEKGIIRMDGCGISRSFDEPFLYLSDEKRPGPPNPNSADQTLEMIELEFEWSTRKQKHLDILKEEILDLRKRKK